MNDTRKIFFRRLTSGENQKLTDVGLLILRLFSGLAMAFQHGLGKLQKLGSENIQFPDPIGIGAVPSLFLAGSAEFFCALAVTLGLFTRLMSLPLAFTMVVAAFIVHGDDPFERKEMALLYLTIFTTLFLTGPGRLSVDHKFFRDKQNSN
jgi:putative oxidoreductase